MNKSHLKILVTGVGGPAGINISRLMSSYENIHVVGCDVDPLATGQCFVDEFVLSPYVRDSKEYCDWMRTMVSTHSFDMIVPTVHEELPLLATFSDTLGVPVLLSPKETLEIGDDKKKAYDWMKNNFPDYTANFILLSEWSKDWSTASKFFIKPRIGRGGRGCRVVPVEELVFLQERNESLEDWIVMELLEGKEWTVDLYVSKVGELVYLVPRERLGLAGGISIKGRTVKHDEVIKMTKQLLTKLEVRGPACIQWKSDAEGRIFFVEINPRFSGGLLISAKAGIDPVAAIIADIDNVGVNEQLWDETTVVGYLDYNNLKLN